MADGKGKVNGLVTQRILWLRVSVLGGHTHSYDNAARLHTYMEWTFRSYHVCLPERLSRMIFWAHKFWKFPLSTRFTSSSMAPPSFRVCFKRQREMRVIKYHWFMHILDVITGIDTLLVRHVRKENKRGRRELLVGLAASMCSIFSTNFYGKLLGLLALSVGGS